jgi:hypothetical protein
MRNGNIILHMKHLFILVESFKMPHHGTVSITSPTKEEVLENTSALVRFEPVNLGSNGKHALDHQG